MDRCLEAFAEPLNKASAAAALPLPDEISAAKLTKLSLFHRRTFRWEGPCFLLLATGACVAVLPPALAVSRIRVPAMLVPTAAPAIGRMVIRRPSFVTACLCTTLRSSTATCCCRGRCCGCSSSTTRLGVRLRGFDRGRFNRRGDGLLLRSVVKGEVTPGCPDRDANTRGDECRRSNSSMEDSFSMLSLLLTILWLLLLSSSALLTMALSSGILSARFRLNIACRAVMAGLS
mmetsp:Transcript_12103/g.22503  ORF Transcript_12103/g.22503 Transcript_12103/m.22503 type:complete len:232 (-) Transcript_12103:58-753(-)